MVTARELRSKVVDTIDGAPLEPLRIELVIELCRWTLAEVPALGLPHLGRTTRTALQLLLAEAVPELPAGARDELARSCEVVAVRGAGHPG
ncbi:hypothetical protein L615_000500000200 [Nocardioides sp. J9]|uniref:hypothetical protein n=1 Tax=unclassified Nocardioides TaxID=2615069 RepID=UPI00048E4ACE|nr:MULTISPECIES: hypothetical protein [unclassified Nocardioides]TWG95076.1 hypothetical protein L615_000500000200 [Nocardioides sp. J9]